MEKIYYNHHISLIQTLPTSSTQYPTQPHTNNSIANSGCTGHYLDSMTTIVHTREPPENPINAKLPKSSTIKSTHRSYIPLRYLSSQEKHAEIFSNLHSSLISIGQLFDDECIVTFDKHKVIVSKKAIGTQQMDYGDSIFIIQPITKNKQRLWSHTYATTVDQWRHSTPEHIAKHPSKT